MFPWQLIEQGLLQSFNGLPPILLIFIAYHFQIDSKTVYTVHNFGIECKIELNGSNVNLPETPSDSLVELPLHHSSGQQLLSIAHTSTSNLQLKYYIKLQYSDVCTEGYLPYNMRN